MLNGGTKLGPYEILSTIGAGGMGEVYKARDSRLDRIVAIKILSGSFTDADRLRRFEQEARTVAALNHPNILGIHDIGNYNGSPYLVSEFLEGKTLREKLEEGPLPLRRASEYALGIAHGLAAAHEKGIVHRDLKPENIFITDDNRIKILDFGLAKLVDSKPLTEVNVTVTRATVPGVILGTVGYMSPEQVRGEPTDARSDIFSFGTVLYEMLTGTRAFKRDTSAETMTAILREEPAELSTSDWHGTPAWERIISRCMEKLSARRFQSASDLAFAIESLSGSSVSASASSPSGSNIPAVKPVRSYFWLIGVAAALLVAAAALFIGKSSVKAEPVKFTRLTYARGSISNARFSSDGQTIIYSAQFGNDPMQVYSVRSDYPQSVRVDLPVAAFFSLSRHGDLSLALNPVDHGHYWTGTLGQAPISGGSPRAMLDEVLSADYSPDGKTMAVVRQLGGKTRIEYPVGKLLYESSGYMDYVRVSPDGRRVAFAEHPVLDDDRGFLAMIDASGQHKQLTAESETIQGLAWAPDGQEIWLTMVDTGQARQLFAVSLSGKVRHVFSSPEGMRILDIAPDGRVLLVSELSRYEINTFDTVSGKEQRGLEWFDGSLDPSISPDGKAILYFEFGGPAGSLYQAVYRKLDGSAPVDLGPGAQPKFSPDGKTAAAILLTRPPQIALYPIGAGESRNLSLGDVTSAFAPGWFPDGKRLYFIGTDGQQALRTYSIDLAGGKPQPLGPPGWQARSFSPDGKRVAGDLSGKKLIYDLETQKTQTVSTMEPDERVFSWSQDGSAILVGIQIQGGFQVTSVDVNSGKRAPLQTITEEDKAGVGDFYYSISPDHKIYAYSAARDLATLYIAKGIK
jgi:serine/threonine protein kinase/sugar lactone lactonase YvrE